MPLSVLMDSARLLRSPVGSRLPVLVENRPQHLVEVLTVLQERLPQYAFLHRAHLAERAVAAAVTDRRARPQTGHADRAEREADQQLRAVLEHARAPERRSDREPPLRGAEPGL